MRKHKNHIHAALCLRVLGPRGHVSAGPRIRTALGYFGSKYRTLGFSEGPWVPTPSSCYYVVPRPFDLGTEAFLSANEAISPNSSSWPEDGIWPVVPVGKG